MPKTHIPFSLKGESLILLEGQIKPNQVFTLKLIETWGDRNEVVSEWPSKQHAFTQATVTPARK